MQIHVWFNHISSNIVYSSGCMSQGGYCRVGAADSGQLEVFSLNVKPCKHFSLEETEHNGDL